MKKTVIKYMVPKEVIFEDGEDLGKRIVETAKQLGADTYHHVKMIDDEKEEADQSYYRVVLQRDFTGTASVWVLADHEEGALAIAKEHKIFSTFETENLEMHEVVNSDRHYVNGNVSQDVMPTLIEEHKELGIDVILDQDIIDHIHECDDGG